MRVTPSNFTIAEYCQQMEEKLIIVNHDYQRSDKVWPPAARSYLIETILLGFPIPKLALYQTTDLKTKRTKKEIVDALLARSAGIVAPRLRGDINRSPAPCGPRGTV